MLQEFLNLNNYSFWNDTFRENLTAALLVLFFYILWGMVLYKLFTVLMDFLRGSNKTLRGEYLIKTFAKPVFYSAFLWGVHEAWREIEFAAKYLPTVNLMLQTLLLLIWARAVVEALKFIIKQTSLRLAVRNGTRPEEDETAPLLRNLAAVVVWFGSLMFIFKIWNIDLTPLLASAGIAGLVLAFAAQDTVSHLFGGISLYFDKPFKVGDRIQLESGEVGDVVEVGLRSTRLKTFDETLIVIPNRTMAGSKVINFSRPKANSKVKIDLNLAYDTDVEQVEKILMYVISNTEGVENHPAPSVHLTDFGAYFLKFLVVVWVANPRKVFAVKTALNKKILEALREAQIEMPYPTQVLYEHKVVASKPKSK